MLIKKLKLQSPNILVARNFYCGKLGFALKEESPQSFTFQCGYTEFTFEYREQKAYYHYAINIPIQLFEKAYRHFEKVVSFLPDPDTGEYIIEHTGWQARAFYFIDPAGNIGEFIAHKNLEMESINAFDINSVIGICEIGWPCESISERYNWLQREIGIPLFSGNLERFCAAGDANGLFILVNKGEKKWFPTELMALAFPWQAEIEYTGKTHFLSDRSGLAF